MRLRNVLLTASLTLTAGCIGSPGGGAPEPMNGAITLFPTVVYTGAESDGTKYAVPVSASGASGMSWTSSDATVAGVSGTDQSATVTAVKTGMAAVTARAGSVSASAMVVVLSYTTAQKAAGAQSYAKFNCAGCHATNGSDITPSGIGKHSDQQIIDATIAGANPEGGDISIGKANHSFAADPGIVAYVRSLAPAGVPHGDN